jgi:hypothetical protein
VKEQDRDEWGRESRRPRPALGCSAIDDDDDDDDDEVFIMIQLSKFMRPDIHCTFSRFIVRVINTVLKFAFGLL